MSIKQTTNQEWHNDEKEWWDANGSYMSYQWSLNSKMNQVLRSELEADYVNYLLKPGEALLDVGCGSGWLSIDFANKEMDVLGIDISETQIKSAISSKKNKNIKNVAFECADLIHWNSKKYENKFQSVFLNAFLHHLPENELKLVFEKISAVMKPGGRVYLYEPLCCEPQKNRLATMADFFFKSLLYLLILYLPKFLNMYSDTHKKELNRGYTMNSPHERPINIAWLDQYCTDHFEVFEVKPWHLYSMAFGMQSMALKPRLTSLYALLAAPWYLIDKCLFKLFGWRPFSTPNRFILCSIKLVKK